MSTATLEIEQSDYQKLRNIAQRVGKSEKDIVHELLVQAENANTPLPDEDVLEEQKINEALRSPQVRNAVLST